MNWLVVPYDWITNGFCTRCFDANRAHQDNNNAKCKHLGHGHFFRTNFKWFNLVSIETSQIMRIVGDRMGFRRGDDVRDLRNSLFIVMAFGNFRQYLLQFCLFIVGIMSL